MKKTDFKTRIDMDLFVLLSYSEIALLCSQWQTTQWSFFYRSQVVEYTNSCFPFFESVFAGLPGNEWTLSTSSGLQ